MPATASVIAGPARQSTRFGRGVESRKRQSARRSRGLSSCSGSSDAGSIRRPYLSHDLVVHLHDPSRGFGRREFPFNSLPAGRCESLGKRPVPPHPLDSCSQGGGISCRNQESRLLMRNGFVRAANSRSYHRPLGCHCLEDRDRQSLEQRGQDDEIGRGQKRRHVRAITEEDTAISNTKRSRLLLQLGSKWPVSSQNERRLGHLRRRGEQDCMTLLRVKPGGGENQIVRAAPEQLGPKRDISRWVWRRHQDAVPHHDEFSCRDAQILGIARLDLFGDGDDTPVWSEREGIMRTATKLHVELCCPDDTRHSREPRSV